MYSAVAAVTPAIVPVPVVPPYIAARFIPVTCDITRRRDVVRLFINDGLRRGCRENGSRQQQGRQQDVADKVPIVMVASQSGGAETGTGNDQGGQRDARGFAKFHDDLPGDGRLRHFIAKRRLEHGCDDTRSRWLDLVWAVTLCKRL